MKQSQTFDLRRSEIRERINTINAQAELADGESDELDRLSRELVEVERRYRAAVAAEGDEESIDHRESIPDGSGRELRELRDGASIRRYLEAAARGEQPTGIERDYNAALEIVPKQGVAVPLALLEARVDASTTTAALDGGQPQRSIMQRIFAPGIAEILGVRIDSVPAGRPEWPLLTGGAAPAMTAEDAAQDATAATFSTQSLKPKRLTGGYRFTVEQAAQVVGIEEALRQDLGMAVSDKMQADMLAGNGTDPQVRGFYTALTAPADPSAESDYAAYAGAAATAVDGKHATSEGEVSALIGVASYKHAATKFNTGSGEAGTEAMARRFNMVQASAHVAAAVSDIGKGNILHAGTDAGRGDSIAAMWPALEVIRDPYSGAASGQIRLTWVVLWDFYAAFRAAAYSRIAFKHA